MSRKRSGGSVPGELRGGWQFGIVTSPDQVINVEILIVECPEAVKLQGQERDLRADRTRIWEARDGDL